MSAASGDEPVYSRPPGLAFRRLDDETVIVDARSRQVHVLNGTGSRIWDLLARQQTLTDVVAALVADGPFSAPAAEVHRDVAAFMAELRRMGLILVAGSSGEVEE